MHDQKPVILVGNGLLRRRTEESLRYRDVVADFRRGYLATRGRPCEITEPRQAQTMDAVSATAAAMDTATITVATGGSCEVSVWTAPARDVAASSSASASMSVRVYLTVTDCGQNRNLGRQAVGLCRGSRSATISVWQAHSKRRRRDCLSEG